MNRSAGFTNPDHDVPGIAEMPVMAAAMTNATTPIVVTVLLGLFIWVSWACGRCQASSRRGGASAGARSMVGSVPGEAHTK